MLMDERRESDWAIYPLVRYAQGGPAPDGKALLIEGATAEGGPVRFSLSLGDVQHFIAFLLVSVGQIGVTRGDPAPIPDEAIQQSARCAPRRSPSANPKAIKVTWELPSVGPRLSFRSRSRFRRAWSHDADDQRQNRRAA